MTDGELTQRTQHDTDDDDARHCFHLLVADSGLTECHRYRIYLALCGAELATSELPSSLCSPECDREVAYCMQCLEVANVRNAEAGVVMTWSPSEWMVHIR
ncbi:MAG: hypothetical protein ACRDTX_02640 [Pseudonocardiaceae bacterium]